MKLLCCVLYIQPILEGISHYNLSRGNGRVLSFIRCIGKDIVLGIMHRYVFNSLDSDRIYLEYDVREVPRQSA